MVGCRAAGLARLAAGRSEARSYPDMGPGGQNLGRRPRPKLAGEDPGLKPRAYL